MLCLGITIVKYKNNTYHVYLPTEYGKPLNEEYQDIFVREKLYWTKFKDSISN